MFSRRQRIPGADLKRFKRAISRRSPYFVVAAAKNGLICARFAIVVGTKVDPRSVRRHVLKRRAAAILKKLDLPPLDFVVTLLPLANTISATEFRDDLIKTMSAEAPQNKNS